MFTDPQSVTISGSAKSMPRIKMGTSDSTYRTADETVQLRISHQTTKSRTRRMVRLDQNVIAADPLTAVNVSQSAGVYLVVDEPKFGFTDEALTALVNALATWLTASSSANVAKLLGSES